MHEYMSIQYSSLQDININEFVNIYQSLNLKKELSKKRHSNPYR